MIKKKTAVIFFMFICLTAILYINITNAPFYFDDFDRIKDNPYIRIDKLDEKQLWRAIKNPYSQTSRPVASITFAFNYYFHQYDLAGYHIVNIIIHFINCCLLFLFIRITLEIHRSNDNPNRIIVEPHNNYTWFALFTSIIWLVHPLHTNSVTYIVQRVNSMAALFYLLAFLLYIMGRTSQRQYCVDKRKSKLPYAYFLGAAIAWLLALGSKQTSAVLPVIIVAFEFLFFHNSSTKFIKRYIKHLFILALLILLVLLVLCLGFLYVGTSPLEWIYSIQDFAIKDFENREYTYIERVLTQPRVVLYYLSLIAYPHPLRLNFDYDYPLSHSFVDPVNTTLSMLAIIALIVTALYTTKKSRLVSFGILWFFISLVIESSVIPIAIIFEHRTYLPSMMLPFLFYVLISKEIAYKKIWVLFIMAVAVIASIWTFQRNQVWRDEHMLLEDNVKKSPEKWRPRTGLGLFLAGQGQYEDALKHYYKALQGIPDSAELHYNIGATYDSQKKYEKAIEYYSKALQLDPNLIEAMNHLAPLMEKNEEIDEAINLYKRSLSIKPNNAEIHFKFANVLKKKGEIDVALVHYNAAILIQPDFKQPYYNIGVILVKKENIKDAINYFQKAIEIDSKFIEAYLYLASLYNKQKESDKALDHYAEALKIRPGVAKIYYQMGVIQISRNKLDKALKHFSDAIQIKPDFAAARINYNKILTYKKKINFTIQQVVQDLNKDPDNPILHYRLGLLYEKVGKPDHAIASYQKAVAIKKDFTEAMNRLSLLNPNHIPD